VNTGRKAFVWIVIVVTGLSALARIGRIRIILRHDSPLVPVRLDAALFVYFLSGVFFSFATWSILTERPPVRTWRLLWASAFFLFILSKTVTFGHIGLFDCVAMAFAVGEIVVNLRITPDLPADSQASSDPENHIARS
jgi:hypothetical protein